MIKPVWVELPARNVERALAFYQAVFELGPVEIADDGVRRTATLFPGTAEGGGISLNQTRDFPPAKTGPLVYLDGGEDVLTLLPRVEPAGGKLITGKTSMGQAGCYALIEDTEGNVVALYSAT